MFKVIVDGRVIPANSLERVAARLAEAHRTGSPVRVRVLDRFPQSQQERDLTPAETERVVALATELIRDSG